MRLTGIHHSSIVVTDMARARHFYGRVLGLPEIERPANFTNPVVWFEIGDEHIHLIPSDRPDPTTLRHFALHVDDARAAREHLRSQGVEVRETEPIAGADRFFIQDPDGNSLELIQWSKRWGATSRDAVHERLSCPLPSGEPDGPGIREQGTGHKERGLGAVK